MSVQAEQLIESAAEITDEEARFFLESGYLVLRGVVRGEELSRVRSAMDELTALGSESILDDPDYKYGDGHRTGEKVLRRIEYVIDKRDEMKVLLGHPFILRSVEKLMGPDFFPTWDSMVLKLPGEGIIVPWHRDAGTQFVGDRPIFNVDFYLDEADENTCVWVIPGSHKWPIERADAEIARRNGTDDGTRTGASDEEGFETAEAVPALMQPGDVLFHDILVLHGSPANSSGKLRRVVYYEFRTAHVEESLGPHVPEYILLKQNLLLACIERRKRANYLQDESPYRYCPPSPYDSVNLQPGEDLPTYRYPHELFWRSGT